MTLPEILPNGTLKRLAALAPADTPPAQKPASRSQGRRRKQEDLGSLQVEKYLDHYGVQYTVKAGEGKTIYRLHRCLFDPSHRRNEASIVQDTSGKLTYQCFHNSCQGRTWADARTLISGDARVAEFCEGYDPAKTPKRLAVKTDQPGDFLSVSEKGRVTFNPALFADHLGELFKPVINEGADFGGLFYRYNGSGLWKPLPEAVIQQRACEILCEEAKSNRLNDALNLFKHKVFVPPEKLTPDPMWLNTKNCMLNVETLERKPHSPEFMSRVQLPVNDDPDATCPVWIETLAGIFEDDLSKADVVQEFFGYCLYPEVLFPCALFAIGPGGNGKGTVEHAGESILGRENISHISLQRMEERFGPAELKDKLLNACGETSDKRLEVTNFKAIAAADEIQAERKYLPDLKFRPIAKHLISMNSFPGIRDQTHAFFRRIIVVEFLQKFEGERADVHLKEKLEKERDGIFRWALEGLRRVLDQKAVSQPESVLNAKNRFRQWVNPVCLFVDEACDLGETCKAFPADVFKRYRAWCDGGGVRPVGKQRFYEQLQLNFPVRRSREWQSTRETFVGIALRPEE